MKCCGGVYNGFKGCVSDHFTHGRKKDSKVIFQNILTGRYYCATCLFQEPEFDGYPDCKGIKPDDEFHAIMNQVRVESK
jgi:hypothetical protein